MLGRPASKLSAIVEGPSDGRRRSRVSRLMQSYCAPSGRLGELSLGGLGGQVGLAWAGWKGSVLGR